MYGGLAVMCRVGMIYIDDIYPIYIRYFQLKISDIFDIFNKIAYCIAVKACNYIFYVHSNVYAYWVPSYIEADPKLAILDLQHRSSKQCCGSDSGHIGIQ